MADKNYKKVKGIVRGKETNTVAVYTYDPEHALDYWMGVRVLIEDWGKTHPNDMKEHLEAVKWKRQLQNNKFGVTDNENNMRALVSIPEGLIFQFKRHFPDLLLEKSRIEEFARKFPGFRLCEVV